MHNLYFYPYTDKEKAANHSVIKFANSIQLESVLFNAGSYYIPGLAHSSDYSKLETALLEKYGITVIKDKNIGWRYIKFQTIEQYVEFMLTWGN